MQLLNILKIFLIIYHLCNVSVKLLLEELESFCISWTSRMLQKSISLVVITENHCNSLDKYNESMEIIKKYIRCY